MYDVQGTGAMGTTVHLQRQLVEGHWVLAFADAAAAAHAAALVTSQEAHMRRLYRAALSPLLGPLKIK